LVELVLGTRLALSAFGVLVASLCAPATETT
jgi:hypothetical protein